MSGIAEALVATGVGLLVALPAVATYNAFIRHVETATAARRGATRTRSSPTSRQAERRSGEAEWRRRAARHHRRDQRHAARRHHARAADHLHADGAPDREAGDRGRAAAREPEHDARTPTTLAVTLTRDGALYLNEQAGHARRAARRGARGGRQGSEDPGDHRRRQGGVARPCRVGARHRSSRLASRRSRSRSIPAETDAADRAMTDLEQAPDLRCGLGRRVTSRSREGLEQLPPRALVRPPRTVEIRVIDAAAGAAAGARAAARAGAASRRSRRPSRPSEVHDRPHPHAGGAPVHAGRQGRAARRARRSSRPTPRPRRCSACRWSRPRRPAPARPCRSATPRAPAVDPGPRRARAQGARRAGRRVRGHEDAAAAGPLLGQVHRRGARGRRSRARSCSISSSTRTGRARDIKVVEGLGDGLTEAAIAALAGCTVHARREGRQGRPRPRPRLQDPVLPAGRAVS